MVKMECIPASMLGPQFVCQVDHSSICKSKDGLTSDPSPLTIKPIKTLESALQWEPQKLDMANVASAKLRSSTRPKDAPKTLICHDMKGGYLEDKFPQGCRSLPCYNFLYWNYIDTFIYFSHNFLTIPPPCWSNAAHSHGVKCLGTLITEWEEGALICQGFLKDEESYLRLVDQMVAIAEHYNFDGWLINIENVIKPEHVPNLVKFVTQLSKRIKLVKPESEIIWYDSVTVKGDLKWQNELNTLNMSFFESCDGIFLNYTWNNKSLDNSSSAAKERLQDVYVGVDVFGRGCFGGGGFDTNKAVKKAREYGLSVAIFAPGWVFECLSNDNLNENQAKFWGLLTPYLYEHYLDSLPITTNFCQGEGNKFFVDGITCGGSAWTNISCQSLQSCCVTNSNILGNKEGGAYVHGIFNSEVGFDGGGALEICGQFNPMERTVSCDVISCSVQLDSPIHISTTIQKQHGEFDYFLVLHFNEGSSIIVLTPYSQVDLNKAKSNIDQCVSTYAQASNNSCEMSNYLVVPQEEFESRSKSPFSTPSPWSTHIFKVDNKDCHSKTLDKVSILLKAKMDSDLPFSLYLGELNLLKYDDVNVCFPVFSSVTCENVLMGFTEDKSGVSLHFTLSWQLEGRSDVLRFFDIYHLSGDCKNRMISYLGRAFSTTYRASFLNIHTEDVTILVQPVSYGNVRLEVEKCPCITVAVQCQELFSSTFSG